MSVGDTRSQQTHKSKDGGSITTQYRTGVGVDKCCQGAEQQANKRSTIWFYEVLVTNVLASSNTFTNVRAVQLDPPYNHTEALMVEADLLLGLA